MNPDDLKKLKVTGSCTMGNLQDAVLRGIDLRSVNLLAANLSGANLSEVNLRVGTSAMNT